jgi:ABC-type Zn uptake system ZnuABC Zn-binding protein ZnuA
MPRLPGRSILWLTLAGVAVTSACARPTPDRRRVAASIFPLYDLARRVGGDRLKVELVLPPGNTTHHFDAAPRDVARLSGSSLVFGVGLGLDGWLSDLVRNAGADQVRIFELGPLVDPALVPADALSPPAAEGTAAAGPIDPHFWLDPVRMRQVVDLMVDACRNLDPEGGPGYTLRGDEVKASLLRLHTELEARKERWKGAPVVTFHGSLFYFARRYGVEVAAVVEPIPGQEPTPRHLESVVRAAREKGARALFTEPQLHAGPAQAIARETGLPVFEIDPVGGLPATDSYEKLLLQIAGTLERALASPAPSPAATP